MNRVPIIRLGLCKPDCIILVSIVTVYDLCLVDNGDILISYNPTVENCEKSTGPFHRHVSTVPSRDISKLE